MEQLDPPHANLPSKTRAWNVAIVLSLAVILLLQFRLHRELIWDNYPYENWDEIGTSNSAMILSFPEVTQVYRYGSLDTFLHIAAHFIYFHFNQVGKYIQRRSFSNNVLETIKDPNSPTWTKVSADSLDYHYFRGINDRHSVFTARQIYLLALYALLLVLGMVLVSHLGSNAWFLIAVALFFSLSPLLRYQATQALPNAISAILVLITCACAVGILRTGHVAFYVGAGVLFAVGLNLKIEFLVVAGLLAATFFFSAIQHYKKFISFLKNMSITALAFAFVFIVTRPTLLWRPLVDWEIQKKGLTLTSSAKVEIWPNLQHLQKYITGDLFSIHTYSLHTIFEWILYGILLLLLIIASWMRVKSNRMGRGLEYVALLAGILCCWCVPVFRSNPLYERYFLNGAAIVCFLFGLILHDLSASQTKSVRMIAVLMGAFVLGVYGMRWYSLNVLVSSLHQSQIPGTRLDSEYSRNRAVAKLLTKIQAQGMNSQVFVDQHSYLDMRFLIEHKIKANYINMYNYDDLLKSVTAGQPTFVIYADGYGGWTGSEGDLWTSYMTSLKSLKILEDVPGNVMNTLSPAPVHPFDRIVIAEAGVKSALF